MVDFLIYTLLALTWFFVGRWSVTSMLPLPEKKEELEFFEHDPVDVGEDWEIAQGGTGFRYAPKESEE